MLDHQALIIFPFARLNSWGLVSTKYTFLFSEILLLFDTWPQLDICYRGLKEDIWWRIFFLTAYIKIIVARMPSTVKTNDLFFFAFLTHCYVIVAPIQSKCSSWTALGLIALLGVKTDRFQVTDGWNCLKRKGNLWNIHRHRRRRHCITKLPESTCRCVLQFGAWRLKINIPPRWQLSPTLTW